MWPDAIRNYEEENMFKADETRLFYKINPDQMLQFKAEQCTNGKLSKIRITILLCANTNGSENQKLTTVSKSKNTEVF